MIGELHPKRKYGIFELSLGLIEQRPDIAQAIMAKVIVLETRMIDQGRTVSYHAISDLFKPVKQGMFPPIYRFIIFTNKEGKIKITGAEKTKQN